MEKNVSIDKTEIRGDLVRKIAALRRVAEKAGTPEEAAAFAAKANEMLLKYNIAEMDVIGWQPDDLADFVNDDGFAVKTSWRQILCSAVGNANFCRIVRARDHSKAGGGRPWWFRLVGRRENVAAAKDQYEWLSAVIERLARDGYRDYVVERGSFAGMESQAVWTHAFKVGCAEIVGRRLRDERRKQEADAVQSNALIKIDDQLQKALTSFYPALRPMSQRGSASSSTGYGAGREAGRNMGLGNAGRISAGPKRLT